MFEEKAILHNHSLYSKRLKLKRETCFQIHNRMSLQTVSNEIQGRIERMFNKKE